jgi:hypothetical protein
MPYDVPTQLPYGFVPRQKPALALVPSLPEKRNVPVIDRLCEVLTVIHKLDDVVDSDAVDALFARVVPSATELCPMELRSELRRRISAIERRREKPSLVVEAPGERSSRFDLILSHIVDGTQRSPEAELMAIVELVTMAVESAQSPEILKTLLRRVPAAKGVVADNIIALLAKGIPSWDVKESARPVPQSIRAIEKVIRFATDETARATRFRELMLAAADALNEGAFAAAVLMLELSERVLSEVDLHQNVTDRIRMDALRVIEEGPFDTFLTDSIRHAVLRKVLHFFPTMHVSALIEQFCDAQLRDRRPRLGNLLVVWGAESRPEILRRLDTDLAPDAEGDYLHDLYAVLSRLPAPADDELAGELEVLDRASTPGRRHDLVVRAITTMGGIKTHDAAKILVRRLAQFESLPFRSDKSFYSIEQVHGLLDATVAALAHIATADAVGAIVRHGLSNRSVLGDTRLRLRHLSALDLSMDLNTVEALTRQISEELPARIFGRGVAVRPGNQPTAMIQALASTSHATVRSLLADIAEKYASLECGQAAAKAIADRRQPADIQRLTRTGSLQGYSLPSLIYWLVESQATGLLSLATDKQEIRGRIWFLDGNVIHGECGSLQGVAALYELLEQPVTGSFAFTERRVPEAVASMKLALPLKSVIREGLRRHEELRRIAAMIPDDSRFVAGAARPTPDPVENDGDLLRRVWLAAITGEPVSGWEPRIAEDTWRIRRIVARWFEEGALKQKVR